MIGLIFGLVAGALGIIQALFTAATWAQSIAAEATRFPPGYTGYRDGTNLVRGGFLFWLGTSAVAGFACLVLCFEAACIVAQAYQQRLIGVLAAWVVWATGWAVYLVVNQDMLMPHLDLPSGILNFRQFALSSSSETWVALLLLGGTLLACVLAGLVGAEAGTPPVATMISMASMPPQESS